MDNNRFDTLTRRLSVTDSRRGVFRSIGVAGLGLGLLRLGQEETLAKHHKHRSKRTKKSPPPPTQYLGDTCLDDSQCVDGLPCEISNSQNSCYVNAVQRCCIPLGGHCNDGCECCGVDVICDGHMCHVA